MYWMKIFKNSSYISDFKIAKIQNNWENIVGEQLSGHTKPSKLVNNILYVNCDHQGWINTMQFFKKEIFIKIKDIFNGDININDIRFIFKINNKK